jgi:hypothetical protein
MGLDRRLPQAVQDRLLDDRGAALDDMIPMVRRVMRQTRTRNLWRRQACRGQAG